MSITKQLPKALNTVTCPVCRKKIQENTTTLRIYCSKNCRLLGRGSKKGLKIAKRNIHTEES